ncbi:hypothetical protein H5410_031071 [Solanum commersonii]|uniref:SKP1 component POZ domain-containing protein n=1 Tax=Solanum commersonii TaxID=4109 RepID=A0A9J5YI24_SOLCO|nr:hypothetical protein H5410_031071 [Solanum commersonii]
MIENDYDNTIIPLPKVNRKILAKVIESQRHLEVPKAEDKTTKEDLKTFDAEFVKFDESTLFNLMLGYSLVGLGLMVGEWVENHLVIELLGTSTNSTRYMSSPTSTRFRNLQMALAVFDDLG